MRRIQNTLWLAIWLAGLGAAAAGPRSGLAAQAAAPATIYLPAVYQSYAVSGPGDPGYCLAAEEAQLADLLNAHRRANGLADVPASKSLSTVAQWHVRDLQLHNPASGTDPRGQSCNLHSWSAFGDWTPVCYTSDHYYASGMWLKPNEITHGVYSSYGFEIAVGGQGWTATAEAALDSWKSSPPHNAVILEQGVWAGYQWPAMGVGVYGGYAVTWFGRAADPAGTIAACGP